MIFLQNSTGKITHKQYHFLCNILSRYVLFDSLFYDGFCFIDYCVTPFFYETFCFTVYRVILSPSTRSSTTLSYFPR